jgi:HAD superfamily hydrolase (TIGR01450 family)
MRPDVLSGLRASDRFLADTFDLALLDLDGVVYVGRHAVPGAVSALTQARARGMRTAFVTNNAARTPAAVSEHLVSLGIPAPPQEVVTSAMAAAALLAQQLAPGTAVLVVGGEGLRWAVREQGLRPVSTMADAPLAVVQGFASRVQDQAIQEAVCAVRAGLPWVATNTDLTRPIPTGLGPGNGTLVARVRAATGAEPVVAGKPQPTLFHEVVARFASRRPLVVGDQLATDIEGARTAGIPGLLVFTGVSDVAEVLAAEPHRRPCFLGRDLGALLENHPAPESGAEDRATWCCREAVVRVDGATLRVLRSGADALDVLRAACAGWWAYRDALGPSVAAPRPEGIPAVIEVLTALEPTRSWER